MGEAFPPPFVVDVLDSPTMILHILEPLLKSRTGFAEHRQPTMEHGTPGQKSLSAEVVSCFSRPPARSASGPRDPWVPRGPFGAPGGTQGPLRGPWGTQGPFGPLGPQGAWNPRLRYYVRYP